MKNNKIAEFLKTTSLVAGALALPACTSTAGNNQNNYTAYDLQRSEQFVAAELPPQDGAAFTSAELANEDGFVVEMVMIEAGDAGATISTDTSSYYTEAFGPKYRRLEGEGAEIAPYNVTRYGMEFGPAYESGYENIPVLYDIAFGPAYEGTVSLPVFEIAIYENEYGPAYQEVISYETARYDVEFGPMMQTVDQTIIDSVIYTEVHGVAVMEQPPASGLEIAQSSAETTAVKETPFAQSISDGELSTYRGAFTRETTFSADNADQVNANVLTGTSAYNVATNVITGDNSITPGAINFNGVGSFILNSGNNAVVQNSTIINLNLGTAGQAIAD